MKAEEASAFEAHPRFEDILRLRAWDEAAKVEGGEGLDLDTVRALAETYRRQHGAH